MSNCEECDNATGVPVGLSARLCGYHALVLRLSEDQARQLGRLINAVLEYASKETGVHVCMHLEVLP